MSDPMFPGFSGVPGGATGYLIAATGAIAIATGFFAFCPISALAGRD